MRVMKGPAMPGSHTTILITNCADETLLAKQRTAQCDVVYLDLEDGVAHADKEEARMRAIRVLRDWDYGGKERWVRPNPMSTPIGMRDVLDLVASAPDALVLSKVRSAEEIVVADYLISRREEELGLRPGQIKLAPMIESGLALLHLEDLITASPRVVGVNLGAEDLSVDLGLVRTEGEDELRDIRSRLVLTSHALGVECYDVASVKLRDFAGLFADARRAYLMGFDGKKVISPSQLEAVRAGFTPTTEEVQRARRLLARQAQAQDSGESVYAFEDRMVDAPFVRQAEQILRRADHETNARS